MINVLDICISPTSTIKEAMEAIGNGRVKIALIVEDDGKFLGTLNDGDIRRSILRGRVVSESINDVYNTNSVFADNKKSQEELLNLCQINGVSQIPIINKDNNVVDLFVMNERGSKQHQNTVVLMVGGLGTRLRPLTDNIPKPMLGVGGTPILQTIVEGFSRYGFTNFIMCLGYKADVIREHFQDGSKFGVNIEYIVEDKRMGTAGALTLLNKKLNETFFVMNGDILTKANYEQLLDFHKLNKAKATMCIREYDIEVPYGVVNINNERIVSIEEKPIHNFFVNTGIYLLEPECIDMIPNDGFYDMPSLFEKLINLKERVISYPLMEYWLDIGHIDEYDRANHEYCKVFR